MTWQSRLADLSRWFFGGAEEKQFSVPIYQQGRAQLQNFNYATFAREGYMNNELVYACIRELMTSASEPEMMFRARRRSAWKHEGPVIELLDRPNPWQDRNAFIQTVIMHEQISGNAYALKVRSASGRVVELWTIRPDRIRIVPGADSVYISHYEYHVGDGRILNLPEDDVIHFKLPHPLDDWYGLPPLMAISGRIDIDTYMKNFVKTSFENGGVPGAVLTVKQKVSPDDKEAIRNRWRNTFSGPGGWHELLILDNAESTYTPMQQSLGTRGLVVPELDEIMEARIPMVFGVPQSLIGTRTSYENGGYANKRAESTDFWQNTLIPLYESLAGALSLHLAPDFFGVTEIAFDMEDVWALREDMDKLAERWSMLAQRGVASIQEARVKVGLPAEPKKDDLFLVPSNSLVAIGPDLEEANPEPEPEAPPRLPPPTPAAVGSNGNGNGASA